MLAARIPSRQAPTGKCSLASAFAVSSSVRSARRTLASCSQRSRTASQALKIHALAVSLAALIRPLIPRLVSRQAFQLLKLASHSSRMVKSKACSVVTQTLFEESSDTYTVGAVWQPDFVDGLALQVDYYNITVDDAIATVGLQTLFNECYRDGISNSCAPFFGTRNPTTGEFANPFVPNLAAQNISTLEVEGIDVNITYGFDADQLGLPADAGSFTFQYYGSYALTNGFQTSPTADFIDCIGFYAGNCGEPTPEYKHTAQFGWLFGPLTTNLRWRYIGSLVADEDGVGFAASDFSDDIGAFNYLDVTTQYSVNENLDLTVGVQNITGKDAPQLGSTFSEQGNTWPATYTTLGRQLFFGATVRF